MASRVSSDPLITVETGGNKARISSAPLISMEIGGNKARISSAPLISMETGGNKARISSAPLISMETGGNKVRIAAAPLIVLMGLIASPPTVTDFTIECSTKNIVITGTNFISTSALYLTKDGVAVGYTMVYITSTQMVAHITNFQNGNYCVRVT